MTMPHSFPFIKSAGMRPVLLISCLALYTAPLSAQANQAALLAAQAQFRRDASRDTSALFKMLAASHNERKGHLLDDFGLDSASLTDDSASLQTLQKKPLSVYQKSLQRIQINPDSLLAELPVFGMDIFSSKTARSAASDLQVPVPADYIVSGGDEIVITLWGRINEETRVTITRDGSINLPRIGVISVAGQSFTALQTTILQRIQAIEGVQASVTMGTLSPIQVYIVGEVEHPGVHTLSALATVPAALFAAGGIRPHGSLRNVQLVRNGRTLSTVDLYDFLIEGNNFANLRLKSGDVIVIPVIEKMAAVAGNVKRGALYELKGQVSLSRALVLAGGLAPSAWLNRIQVERFNKNSYQTVIDISNTEAKAADDFFIQDGDIIKIFPVVELSKNSVYLAGNIKRPGMYSLSAGMRIRDILGSFEDCLPETYLDYAVICRKEPPAYSDRIIPFSLQTLLQDAASADNLALMDQDTIIIYHRDFFEPDRFVSIHGAVTTPDTFRLMHDMRIKDLILQAGGLTDQASSNNGELYRRNVINDSVFTQKITFCISCALQNDVEHNLELRKMDRVYIRPKRGWEEERRVFLGGEFVYPGEYILLPGETLGQLVRRAGGFSENAFLEAGLFTRRSVKAMEAKRNAEYIRTLESDIARMLVELAAKDRAGDANQVLQQQLNLLERLRDISPIGRVVIDLKNQTSYQDFNLEDGDSLSIPRIMNTVSVLGEVFNPSTFQHDQDRNEVKNYLSLCGGLKQNADRRNVYVVKANGSVVNRQMLNVKRYELKAGDVVVVPQRIRYVNGYRVFIDVIDTIYKVALTAAVVGTVTR